MGSLFCCVFESKKEKNSSNSTKPTNSNNYSTSKNSPNKNEGSHYNDNLNLSFSKMNERGNSNNSHLSLTKPNLEDFEEITLLGRGTFGKVLLVRRKKTNKLYAMKVLKKSVIKIKNQEDHTKTERKILEKIDHPFIVKLHYAFQNDQKLFLVTEFMQGGELFYHLRKDKLFKEDRARFYICEIILALEFLHKNNFIYRDLKPENILIGKDGHIRLTDFGLSKITLSKNKEDCKAFTICGTPEYLAPEILLEEGYDKTVDWWSLGALTYEMLAGYSPYKTGNQKLDIEVYKKKVYMQPYFSEDAKSLITGLLTVDPKKRLGYKDDGALNVKSHPFFKNVNWDQFVNLEVTPPFIPEIIDNQDTSNFDKMFTDENIKEPNSDRNILFIKENAKNNYDGFTFTNDTGLPESVRDQLK